MRGSPSMVGGKMPAAHRFHLSNGMVLRGEIYRQPKGRLSDHLSTLKGFISVLDAESEATGERYPFLTINVDHVVVIEELQDDDGPAA